MRVFSLSSRSVTLIAFCVTISFTLLQGGCTNPPSRPAREQGASLSAGTDAYQRGDFAAAAMILRLLAVSGNADAQDLLGRMYQYGQGVPQDYAQAVEWFLKAGEQGNTDAQVRLGTRYFNGEGVPQDYSLAMKWYQKAAGRSVMARYNLALMYGDGEGVPEDDSKAQFLFRQLRPEMLKDAQEGNIYAQSSLAQMYLHGQGVTQDNVQAAAWYKKAAIQGDEPALNRLGGMYKQGQGVSQDIPMAYVLFCAAAALPGISQSDAKDSCNSLGSKMTPAQIKASKGLVRQAQLFGVASILASN